MENSKKVVNLKMGRFFNPLLIVDLKWLKRSIKVMGDSKTFKIMKA